MKLRTYRKNEDFPLVSSWLGEERTHALWCAGLFPYPLAKADFERYFEEREGDARYVLTEEDGRPVGFCAYSVNEKDNSGFVKLIVVDTAARGRGYGVTMLELLKHAFEISRVDSVSLNVFAGNTAARNCYHKAGFTETRSIPGALEFHGEIWDKFTMTAERKQA